LTGPDPPRHDHSRGKAGRTLPRASAASRTFANTATIHTMTTAADPVFALAASCCLPETRVRSFNFEKQTCTGAEAWLTSTSWWACGYRCDGTASVSPVQRYYASTYGRFNTADPYQASGGPASPASWNRYSYTRGDPVNRLDPSGLRDNPCDGYCGDDGGGGGDWAGGYDVAGGYDFGGGGNNGGYDPVPGCLPGEVCPGYCPPSRESCGGDDGDDGAGGTRMSALRPVAPQRWLK
jgi:RHS repeat-associated protein